jgi:molybdopterin synthase sulfur carrier subunit
MESQDLAPDCVFPEFALRTNSRSSNLLDLLFCGAEEMAKVIFTPNIQRHVLCPDAEAAGRTVREVLENVFAANPQARGYVLDDQSGLRKHMTIFVDGMMVRDRARLADGVNESSTIYVFQALSGG